MFKNVAFLFATLILTSQYSNAQFFERIYPNTGIVNIGSIDNCLDSGFIICGSHGNGILMKLKVDGDTEWIKNDSSAMYWSSAVIQNSSGNFVVVGTGRSQQFNSVAMTCTYDSDGVFLSSDSILPVDGWGTSGISITRSPNRDHTHYWYYLDGFTASNNTILDDGSILGGDMTSIGQNSVSVDNSGQYYAEGNLLFDLDTGGVWRNNILRLSGNSSGYYYYDTDFTTCTITSDGGVMVAGIYDTSGATSLRMIKLDASGDPFSDRFLVDSTLTHVYDIKQTSDGGYAILCSGNSGGDHIVFLSVDSSGILRWKNDFFGSGTATPANFIVLDDGFVILGETANNPYVIRTDSQGNTNTTGISSGTIKNELVSVFPNPSNGIISITRELSKDDHVSLLVFDMMGQNVFSSGIDQRTTQLNLSFLAKGVYLFRFTSHGEELQSGKMIIE